jgi:hypothetical protein
MTRNLVIATLLILLLLANGVVAVRLRRQGKRLSLLEIGVLGGALAYVVYLLLPAEVPEVVRSLLVAGAGIGSLSLLIIGLRGLRVPPKDRV